jgi:hypothetical protein
MSFSPGTGGRSPRWMAVIGGAATGRSWNRGVRRRQWQTGADRAKAADDFGILTFPHLRFFCLTGDLGDVQAYLARHFLDPSSIERR